MALDLHCHLNGSLSLSFLQKAAKRNKKEIEYEELVGLQNQYFSDTKPILDSLWGGGKGGEKGGEEGKGFSINHVKRVWEQFGIVHKIIITLQDIEEGVIDVVGNSTADYLEIRTTPKSFPPSSQISPSSLVDYISAFQKGLQRANDQFPNKTACGILSLDRTVHSLSHAHFFMDCVLASKGILVGIDLSGNPEARRTLTGEHLGEMVRSGLKKGVGIGLHIGESKGEVERRDVDIILEELSQWASSFPSSSREILFQGKIRLGHGIYLAPKQSKIIQALALPIEVCPTCHLRINWFSPPVPHPVSLIYPSLSLPILMGTDDCLVFGSSSVEEWEKMKLIFSWPQGWSEKEVWRHQQQFAFGREGERERERRIKSRL